MAISGKTWWGTQLLEILNRLLDQGRLSRGRSYGNPRRIEAFDLLPGRIIAKVIGNKNPYFGVYKVPKYSVEIRLKTLTSQKWKQVIDHIGSDAACVTRLLMSEMPDEIETIFQKAGESFLPSKSADLITSCSCPDYANPCKHIAGVYYYFAQMLDEDPFLMFTLKGLEKGQLLKKLSQTPIGEALSQQEGANDPPTTPDEFLNTKVTPQPLEKSPSFREFWYGSKTLPNQIIAPKLTPVEALLVKRLGENPPFWNSDQSYIKSMEQFYRQVRKKRQWS